MFEKKIKLLTDIENMMRHDADDKSVPADIRAALLDNASEIKGLVGLLIGYAAAVNHYIDKTSQGVHSDDLSA